jgi:hypothetical protein
MKRVDLRKNIFRRFLNKWFLFYLGSVFFFLICWYFVGIKTLNIISIFAIVLFQFFYNIKVGYKDFFSKLINWSIFFITFLFSIFYIAVTVNEPNVAFSMVIFALVIFFILPSIIHFRNVWKSESFYEIIIWYPLLSFSLILLFGFIFLISGIFSGNEIKWAINNSKLDNLWDFVWFSGSVFYSNTFGDIIPFGYSRAIALLEVAVSFFLHVIILGYIISRFSNQRKNRV